MASRSSSLHLILLGSLILSGFACSRPHSRDITQLGWSLAARGPGQTSHILRHTAADGGVLELTCAEDSSILWLFILGNRPRGADDRAPEISVGRERVAFRWDEATDVLHVGAYTPLTFEVLNGLGEGGQISIQLGRRSTELSLLPPRLGRAFSKACLQRTHVAGAPGR